MQRACPCGNPLTSDGRQKYCSEPCRKDAVRKRDLIRCANERDRRNAYAAQYRMNFPVKVAAAIRRVRNTPEGKAKKQAADAAWHETHREHANKMVRRNYHRTRANRVWMILLNAAKARARKRQQPYDLTREWAAARWTGHCEITGLPFATEAIGRTGKIYSASIDKIDPKLGYVQPNCRFVLFAVNTLKHDGADEDMYFIAAAITRAHKGSQSFAA